MERENTVYTLTAKCRDCYRCLKACPVKAIRMKDGQAYVEQDRCIACGTCIRECPQKAKVYVSTLHTAKKIMAAGTPVAASLAPSFAAFYPGWKARRLPSALRRLGFTCVAETSEAAPGVAAKSAYEADKRKGRASLCTACPAVVNYVEKYRPDRVGALLAVASPMIAHAKGLKKELAPGTVVIFIGPCVAKKQEAARPENIGAVDCVITFEELDEWMAAEGVELKNCEESAPDRKGTGFSPLFPVPGGLFRTAGIDAQPGDAAHVHVSGAADVIQAIDGMEAAQAVIEPLFCSHGCINGPAGNGAANLFERRGNLAVYAAGSAAAPAAKKAACEADRPPFSGNGAVMIKPHTQEEIDAVLLRTGKTPGDGLLNCGACGYAGCREKAAAVLDGMAELEMCLPYMRRLAEQRTDMIIETSPNGIVITDAGLKVIKMNPAFKRYFSADDTLLGADISVIMDPAQFERLAAGAADNLETAGDVAGGYCLHGLYYALRDYGQYVGIFVDITRLRQDREQLETLREQTADQAKLMLNEQVQMSQQIAWQLGENMARTEALVKKLTELAGEAVTNGGKKR